MTIATVAAMAAAAIAEEVTFQGYLLQSLGERWPLWAPTVGSELVFAAVANAGCIRDGWAMPRGHSSAFERRRIPDERLPSIELMPVLRHRSPMHGLFEVDVTLPRALLREQRETTGQAWSFTAFLITCLARAIAENPHVQGFRTGRRVVVFREVDVATLVEGGTGQSRAPGRPHRPGHREQVSGRQPRRDPGRAAGPLPGAGLRELIEQAHGLDSGPAEGRRPAG